jgi:hypothetical protein
MFEECVAPLVDGLFQGYNATVLAYGQVMSTPCQKKKKKKKKEALIRTRPLIISYFLLVIDTYLCCRQDLGKHIPWELASRMVATQDLFLKL